MTAAFSTHQLSKDYGDRPALHVRGASDHFDVPPSAYDKVFDAPIIHLGGTGFLKTLDGPASVTLLKEAKRRGRTVTFDLIAASADTIGIVEPLLPYIDYFMPSIEEAKDMSGQKTAEDCAKFFLDKGASCCVFTLGGEGAYYAPELTRVVERRGTAFIDAMLRDPERLYPGQRRMYRYAFSDAERADLIAFLQWCGNVDLNGFPPRPPLAATAVDPAVAAARPTVFNQICVACHKLGGQGGAVGPALDGVGLRLDRARLVTWLRDPPAVRPGTAMPKLPLDEAQIQELATFLSSQTRGVP